MLKIYFDDSHYNKKFRQHLFPLLKPFVRSESFSDQQRQEVYGVSNQDFNLVRLIQEADLFVLTMSWNYYVESGKTEDALTFINKAAELGKEIWIVSLGDIGYKLPFYNHVKVFRASGFKTKLPNTHAGLPVFKKDPLKAIYHTAHIELPEYTLKPKIGFCGFANGSYFNTFKEGARELVKTIINVFKTHPYEPNTLYIASFVRYKLLKRLQKEKNITTNFIFRKYYRAGVNSSEQRKQTMLEYFNNIKESQYVLCIRGAGNFSVRFYETLAMGRIPVFVNTDCLLPLSDEIDWRSHVVWVEYNDIRNIGQKIVDFHAKLSKNELQSICMSNRKLWENHLSLKGFFKHHMKLQFHNKKNN